MKKHDPDFGYYDVYSEYSRSIRAWFVGYGVGLPALLINNKDIVQKLSEQNQIHFVMSCITVGLLLQIFLVILNKAVMWSSYYGSCNPSFQNGNLYKSLDRLSKVYWIDFLAEVITTILFALATYRGVTALDTLA